MTGFFSREKGGGGEKEADWRAPETTETEAGETTDVMEQTEAVLEEAGKIPKELDPDERAVVEMWARDFAGRPEFAGMVAGINEELARDSAVARVLGGGEEEHIPTPKRPSRLKANAGRAFMFTLALGAAGLAGAGRAKAGEAEDLWEKLSSSQKTEKKDERKEVREKLNSLRDRMMGRFNASGIRPDMAYTIAMVLQETVEKDVIRTPADSTTAKADEVERVLGQVGKGLEGLERERAEAAAQEAEERKLEEANWWENIKPEKLPAQWWEKESWQSEDGKVTFFVGSSTREKGPRWDPGFKDPLLTEAEHASFRKASGKKAEDIRSVKAAIAATEAGRKVGKVIDKHVEETPESVTAYCVVAVPTAELGK